MRKLFLQMMVTLDGVMEDPGEAKELSKAARALPRLLKSHWEIFIGP
jgi:hypothetical protein